MNSQMEPNLPKLLQECSTHLCGGGEPLPTHLVVFSLPDFYTFNAPVGVNYFVVLRHFCLTFLHICFPFSHPSI